MRDEEEKKFEETTRLSSEEVNKQARNKRVDDMSKTQIINREEFDSVNSDNKKTKNKDSKKDKKNQKKKKKLKFKDKHPRIATIMKIFLILLLLLIIIGAGIIFGALWGGFNFFDLLSSDFKIDLKDLVVGSENSYVYDSEGNQLASLSDGTKRISLTLKDMGKYLPNAYIAIEDERFRDHSGVDIKRTAAATFTYIIHKGKSDFGGSSITQQVVKNITQDKEDTAMRKVKEMIKALQVEHYLSKDQILELYLNLIFVGGKDVNGVGLGAIYYFNKDVKDLSLAECAYMAAINNSPNSYDPFKEDDKKQARIEKGQKRAKTVLAKMKELGYIKDKEYKEAIKEIDAGLQFSNGDTNITLQVSYQVDAAITEIIKQYASENGISEEMAKVKIYGGGFKIYTSQKTSVQDAIEAEMSKKDYYNVISKENKKTGSIGGQESMSAIAIADPKTGEIVACGSGFGDGKVKTYLGYYNYCTTMQKQTGSSIKPIAVLSTGLNNGKLTAASTFFDGPTTFPGVYDDNGQPHVYKNEGAYRYDWMTLRDAIAYSQNIPNLKGISTAGVSAAVKFCQSVGIKDASEDAGVGLALGALTNGATVVQMASAYAMISNGGVYIVPTFYQKVTNKKGDIVMQPKSVEERSTRVLSEQNAYIVKNVMQGTVQYGTAAAYGKIPNQDTSSKTGTTNDNFDRWLAGFTPYYTAVCWYGFDKNETIDFDKKNPAGLIWSSVMKQIHSGLPDAKYELPSTVETRVICKDSGKLANPYCTNTFTEYFLKDTAPESCTQHSKGSLNSK